ncbi:MAG TPA: hypothetical protein VLF59_04400 [Candidatus Saccharimonadales bacterium]|nr:hypothetical protein [Candidatus Saccharimonadales bacterium]
MLTDSNNQPIVGMGVFLQGGGSDHTDAAGHFSMSVPRNSYTYLEFSGSNETLGAYDLANIDVGQPGDVNIDLTSSDVVKDFSLDLVTLTVGAKDGDGNNATGATASFATYNAGSTTVSSGTDTYAFTNNSVARSGLIDNAGTYTFFVPRGTVYNTTYPNNLCVFFIDATHTCTTSPFTATTNTSVEVNEPPTSHFSGNVVDAHGNPISNLGVNILTNTGNPVTLSHTDSSGHFSIAVPSGNYSYLQFSSNGTFVGGVHVANVDLGNAGDVNMNLSNQDITQDFTLDLVPMSITAKNSDGTPDAGATASFATYNAGNTTVNSNGNNYSFANHSTNFSYQTDSSAQVIALVPRWTSYDSTYPNNLCAFYTDSASTCINSPFTVGDSISLAIIKGLHNPIGLSANSPATHPQLSWIAGAGAVSYNVYRDGVNVGSSNSTSFTDNTALSGLRHYYVTSVNSFGQESTASNTIGTSVDATAPTITYSVSPLANSNGWNSSDVVITFACNDDVTVVSCTAPITLASNGSGQTVTGTAVDEVGNTKTVTTGAISIDKTNPTISYSVSPAANANGWSNGNIVVTFTCSDALSAIQSCTSPVTVSTESGSQTVTGTAVDKAGNSVIVTTAALKIDKTNPTISYTLSPAPNVAGWNKSSVTVTFTCADTLSGIQACSSPVTISTEGANQTAMGVATDKAGNATTVTVTVKLDKTAPAISTPTMSSTLILFGGTVNVGATTSDILSGVVGGEYYIDTDPGEGNGTALTYSSGTGKISGTATIPSNLSIGQHRLYMRSRDAAGNWSTSVSVTFRFV